MCCQNLRPLILLQKLMQYIPLWCIQRYRSHWFPSLSVLAESPWLFETQLLRRAKPRHRTFSVAWCSETGVQNCQSFLKRKRVKNIDREGRGSAEILNGKLESGHSWNSIFIDRSWTIKTALKYPAECLWFARENGNSWKWMTIKWLIPSTFLGLS